MSIYIKLADFADCQKICDMQRIAFYDILTRYRDYDTNPACETVEVIQNKFRQPFTKYYFIMNVIIWKKVIQYIRILQQN